MRNKQQVADDLVKKYSEVKVITAADSIFPPEESIKVVKELFELLQELTDVMAQYNRGKPNIDDMRAKAAMESVRR
jgi:hypothetical protein